MYQYKSKGLAGGIFSINEVRSQIDQLQHMQGTDEGNEVKICLINHI